ncbi:MAG TPA: penicillin-insensitive murein endopeptidase [Bacteriovoracaceae bacterium]|nr:penicillin-insensitive murein endopeptidase [Bacteriovoracaceae bacterium]
MIVLIFLSLLSSLSFGQQLPMPMGHYARGTLMFGWQLPPEGEGFMRLFQERDNGWASHSMLEVIERVALEMSQLYPLRDRLQVGDISGRNGGRIARHTSHQNGLDVDLAFYRLNGIEQRPEPHRGFLEDMVRRGKISKNFDVQRNWELIKTLHRYGKVQRIFVDRVIKRELCKYTERIGEQEIHTDVLRSIRPYPNHHNHLHVRLHCPDYAHKCTKQEDPIGGSGC